MDTELDSTPKQREPVSTTTIQTHRRLHISFVDIALLVGLTIAALLPRIILAFQLDMVTDEAVYIGAGKLYLPLLEHFHIGANGWSYNYEHPPLVKLLIGLSLSLNTFLTHPLGELLAARIPSIMMGTILVLAIYWIGSAPLGRIVALSAALCLAFSPWLIYFSALAYLDMTMTAFITLAYLLLWHAPRLPALYLLTAMLLGLGAASKYPAVLAIPGVVLFTAYYFFLLRPRLPAEQRPKIPWGWWGNALILAPLTFLAADPAIWPSPYALLLQSFRFQWEHAVGGHLTFLAGQASWHAPHWAILYILLAKMSLFVTVPAVLFACYAFIQLTRFHRHAPGVQVADATTISFLLIWLIAILGMLSLLTIVVGTNYELPATPPVALAAAYGLVTLARTRSGHFFSFPMSESASKEVLQAQAVLPSQKPKLKPYAVVAVIVLILALAGPHLIGLVSVPDAEGYSSELFAGENAAIQVTYPGYRDALRWMEEHIHNPANVGLVTISDLGIDRPYTSWDYYNRGFSLHYHLIALFSDKPIPVYDYLIIPMNLIQRGVTLPLPYHIIHAVLGGNTIYCLIEYAPHLKRVSNIHSS